MGLHNLKAPPRACRKKCKRVGRGTGSGLGGTAGRGHKGQLSRSGAKIGVGFEGGQMPLQRRMPKRGFKNFCRQSYHIVHLGDLTSFESNAVVDPHVMCESGLIRRAYDLVKILSDGKLDKPLIVRAQGLSKAAKDRIEAAGGKAEIIDPIRRRTSSGGAKEG